MKNTVNISITLDADLLAYIDELSLINSRSRSGMIAWIIAKEKAADEALDEEAKSYKDNSTSHEYGTILYPSVTPDDFN